MTERAGQRNGIPARRGWQGVEGKGREGETPKRRDAAAAAGGGKFSVRTESSRSLISCIISTNRAAAIG